MKQQNNINIRKISVSVSLIVSIILILLLSIGIVKAVKNIDFSIFLSLAGKDLKTDAYGHSNFLILGIGGGIHDGADLTDSIIVASLDEEDKFLTMLSIPRDLYIKDDVIGNGKINELYAKAKIYYGSSVKGIEHMKEKVEELTGIPIHYWLKVDFKGFTQLVDSLGGVDVNVIQDINDPFYPKDETILYEPFYLSKGPKHLDGATALKYSRSRKTTSDFDRARRQQQLIYAIKEKALTTKIIFDKEKIQEILDVLKENIETNISVKEILTLGSLSSLISENNILHRLIHDDPALCGGLLYAPDKQLYEGKFVFIAAGGLRYLYNYFDLNFNFPLIAKENPSIYILNGTKTPGIAAETKQVLRRYCFNIVGFENGKNPYLPTTTYYYRKKFDQNFKEINSRPIALDFLKKIIPGEESTEIPPEYDKLDADIIIEIGSNYTNSKDYLEDPFYGLPMPTANTSTETQTEAAKANDSTKQSTENNSNPSVNNENQ